MASALSASHFHSEEAAYAFVEERLWPNGPVCPHCGSGEEKVGKLQGKTTRAGLYKCYACRKQFTVKIGTIFEQSHAPMRYWLQAIYLMCSSKKGISTRQLQRTLGVGMKTAWFMGHRIREAMAPLPTAPKLGGEGKTIEADEAFIGKSPKTRKRPGYQHKMKVLSLVERGGQIRSVPIDRVTMFEIRSAMDEHVEEGTRVVTDSAQHYRFLPVALHESVDHSKGEYVRDDVHTNTLEGFFSVFKRGVKGVYQHIDERHLGRYLAEFDFRQNTRERLGIDDVSRADIALRGAQGKRLTYETTRRQA